MIREALLPDLNTPLPGLLFIILAAAALSVSRQASAGELAVNDLVLRSTARGVSELHVLRAGAATPVRLLRDEMAALDPTVTPAGDVAFMRPRAGQQGLWIVRRDGTGLRPLGTGALDGRMPAFSPDGGRVAFVRHRAGEGSDIWLARPDGTAQVNLTAVVSGGVTHLSPAWSPDSGRLAFASNRGGRFRIWIMSAEGGDSRPLARTPGADLEPAWSPEGGRLAFVRQFPDGHSDLVVLELATGAERRIQFPGTEARPAWSPRGTLIAFASDRHGQIDLFAAAPDGTGLVRLTDGTADESSPAWLPRAATPGARNTNLRKERTAP